MQVFSNLEHLPPLKDVLHIYMLFVLFRTPHYCLSVSVNQEHWAAITFIGYMDVLLKHWNIVKKRQSE